MVVYITTHLTSGKKYIGKDKANSKSYFGSGVEIKNIINKEGTKNLKKDIIEHCTSPSHLSEREEYWLKFHDVENNPLFLNKTNKAFGNSGQTEEGKKKIGDALRGRTRSQEVKNNISEGRKGKKRIQTKIRSDKGVKRGKNFKISKAMKSRDRSSTFKPVLQYDLDMNFIKRYKSKKQAQEENNLKLQNVLVGLTKTCGGYFWIYEEK
tara:strand:- start:333 stop:959 length:627 start_codon:yes stop_codon:yes gene_type:complete